MNKLDAIQQSLQAAGIGADVAMMAKLDAINSKLGPQINGGLSAWIRKLQKSHVVSWYLNMLTLITTLHNAVMLSRGLFETLAETTGMAITAVGRMIGIVGAEETVEVSEILGNSINGFMEGIVGAENWRGMKASWTKWSRIYQAASSIVWSMRSMMDSTREIMEWTAENTGKIGNALKRWRVVGENAYKWMPESVQAQGAVFRKFQRMRDGIDNLEDAASSLGSVTSEVINIQDEITQMRQNKENFEKALKDNTPKPRDDNKPVGDKEAEKKTNSKTSAEVTDTHRNPSDTPTPTA